MKVVKKPVSVLLSFIMILSVFAIVPVSASALDGVSYVDENGETQTANGVTEVTGDTDTFNAGWYAVTSVIDNNYRITCNGDVHLILCDDARLTVTFGVKVNAGSSLTIYGQSKGNGKLELIGSGRDENAALGSDL